MKLLVQSSDAGDFMAYSPPSQPHGTISLGTQVTFGYHRCGWAYAVDALIPEHNDDGITFLGFVDQVFNTAWNRQFKRELPLKAPWTGFIHNPPETPHWFPDNPRLSGMYALPEVRESLQNCVGLFTLSEYLANYLRLHWQVPVASLIHPTEIPDQIFSFDRFMDNVDKQVVAVGWWLRRIMSIFHLPLDRTRPYRKVRLLNNNVSVNQTIRAAARLEFVHDWRQRKLEDRFRENTIDVEYLPHGAYDELLTRNIVYLDLYDTSANNAIVECIARGTPLLINRLPAAVEYLGEEYPFYFSSLEEAAAKAVDFELVRRTHEYLLECPTRKRLSQQTFLADFRASEVYQRLRQANAQRRAAA